MTLKYVLTLTLYRVDDNRQRTCSSAEMGTVQQRSCRLMAVFAEFRCKLLQHVPGNFVIVGLAKLFQ